ncbi:hypothetical protein TNCV_3114851 [Trichonephila clavipes]|nr:hypothetical protein TNCV_3114851 [Trichonephila clavipes]
MGPKSRDVSFSHGLDSAQIVMPICCVSDGFTPELAANRVLLQQNEKMGSGRMLTKAAFFLLSNTGFGPGGPEKGNFTGATVGHHHKLCPTHPYSFVHNTIDNTHTEKQNDRRRGSTFPPLAHEPSIKRDCSQWKDYTGGREIRFAALVRPHRCRRERREERRTTDDGSRAVPPTVDPSESTPRTRRGSSPDPTTLFSTSSQIVLKRCLLFVIILKHQSDW